MDHLVPLRDGFTLVLEVPVNPMSNSTQFRVILRTHQRGLDCQNRLYLNCVLRGASSSAGTLFWS